MQGLENDEDEDPVANLMECWPDNPANVALNNILQLIAPLFEEREFKDGEFLARQGDPARCMFFIEEGECLVYHTKKTDEGLESDDEEEEEVCHALASIKSMTCIPG